MSLLLVVALLVQGDRTVTLPESGEFKDLVAELAKRSGIPLVMANGVADKKVAVAARDVTFWRALDALCRAHGDATYLARSEDFWPPRHLTIRAQVWVEHPCVYAGEFKVLLEGWVRAKEESDSGPEDAVVLYLSVLPPPDTRFLEEGTKWTVTGRDAKGNDLSLPEAPESSKTRLELDEVAPSVSALRHTARLKPFGDGLSVLEGRLDVNAARIQDVEIPLEIGKSVDVPGGTLTVGALTKVKVYSWMETRRFPFRDVRAHDRKLCAHDRDVCAYAAVVYEVLRRG